MYHRYRHTLYIKRTVVNFSGALNHIRARARVSPAMSHNERLERGNYNILSALYSALLFFIYVKRKSLLSFIRETRLSTDRDLDRISSSFETAR